MAIIDSLISYYKLDEASGNALDAHASNPLTENGTVGSAAGIIGNSRDLLGTGTSHFTHADSADFSVGDTDYSIAFWLYLDTVGDVPVQKWDGGSGNREYLMTFSGSQLQVFVDGPGGGVSSVTASNFGNLSTGTWYFVVFYHDSVNNLIGISINAGTPNTTSYSGGLYDSTSTFFLGADTFNGRIDEAGIWRRVLSSQDRTDLYAAGAGLAYPFTVAITGTGELLITTLTMAGEGTVTAPVYSGTGALSVTTVTMAGTGAMTAPTMSGTGALAVGTVLLAGEGTFAAAVLEDENYIGAGALAVGTVTAAGEGDYEPTNPSGTGALAVQTVTMAGAGWTSIIGSGALLVEPVLMGVGNFGTFISAGGSLGRRIRYGSQGPIKRRSKPGRPL